MSNISFMMPNIVPAITVGTLYGVYQLNRVAHTNITMVSNGQSTPGINNLDINNVHIPVIPVIPGPALNPTARPFAPEVNNQSHTSSTSVTSHTVSIPQPISVPHTVLSPIEEEHKVDTFPDIQHMQAQNENRWRCVKLYSSQDILKLRNIIFITEDITKNALRENAIKEHFDKEQDLFYHLRWQCRMQVIDNFYKIFKKDDQELVIFHSDLHSSSCAEALYIIGIENDADRQHCTKWKMTQFMTATDIYLYYNIHIIDLPKPLRPELYKTIQLQKDKYMHNLKHFQVNGNKLMKTEQIKRQRKPSFGPFTITFSQFSKCVTDSIINCELMPIIWFDKKGHNSRYKIQMLLPVRLNNDNWIGIVFDYNNNGKLMPVTICVDHIDIHRKLALFKPLSNPDEYKWFNNHITEIKFTNDQFQRLIWENKEQAKQIKYLKRLLAVKDKQIACLTSNKD